MNRFFLLLLVIISFMSCDKKNIDKGNDDIIIKGKITKGKGKKINLFLLKYNEKQALDSVILNEEGTFSFSQKPVEKSVYLLKKDENTYISLIADKGDSILLEADYDQFEKAYTLVGSEDSKLLSEFNIHLQKNRKTLDSIGEVWKIAINLANRIEIKKQLDSAFFKAARNQYNFQKEFVSKHSASLASLIVLYLPLGREAVLRETKDFALFEKVSIDLLKAMPDNSHAINFAKRIKQKKMLQLENELTEKAKKDKH